MSIYLFYVTLKVGAAGFWTSLITLKIKWEIYIWFTLTPLFRKERLNDSISDHNGVFQSGIFVHFENKVICITHHEPWHGILMSGDKGPRFCKPIYVLVWHIIHWLVLQVAWQILTQRLNIMCYSHFSVKNQLCGS